MMQDDPGDSNPVDNMPALSRPDADAVVATKTAPRVTADSIKGKIRHVSYIIHEHLTLCILELENGFFVVGQSAPASPENFDADVGRRYSYDQAFAKVWELEGYALRCQLHEAAIHGIGI